MFEFHFNNHGSDFPILQMCVQIIVRFIKDWCTKFNGEDEKVQWIFDFFNNYASFFLRKYILF